MQQQPVANDLRVISAAMKMVSDMERIGDQACDITGIVKKDAEVLTIRENTHLCLLYTSSPFTGWKLKGKVKYTICDGKIIEL